jgi:hypothetical protein
MGNSNMERLGCREAARHGDIDSGTTRALSVQRDTGHSEPLSEDYDFDRRLKEYFAAHGPYGMEAECQVEI